MVNNTIYLARKTILPPDQMSFLLDNIDPGTECNFVLKAVYNPASIDSGILTSCKTLPYSKSLMFDSFSVHSIQCELYKVIV